MSRARALVVVCGLGLSVLGCKRAAEHEAPGAAERIDDHVYFEQQLELDQESRLRSLGPASLHVDVHADVIYVQHDQQLRVIPRGDGQHHELELEGFGDDGQLIAVPGRDDLLVWDYQLPTDSREDSRDVRRVLAARVAALDQPWTLFDYQNEDAVHSPVVVGDRVALLTPHTIVHTSLEGGGVGVLSLALPAVGAPSLVLSQQLPDRAGHLVWIASIDQRTFVVSSDATFEAAVIEYEQRDRSVLLLAGAKLSGSLVTVSLVGESEDRVPTLLIERHTQGAKPAVVELWRQAYRGVNPLRFVADGAQGWLVVEHELWRIGANEHAPVQPFLLSAQAYPPALALDDGVLLWTTLDDDWQRFHATAAVSQPLRVELSSDDAELGASIKPTELAPDLAVADDTLPRVRVVGGLAVDAGLETAMHGVIYRILRAHVPEVRSCYSLGLEKQPELSGTVEIELVIGPDGKVRKLEDVTGDRFASRSVRRCVTKAARKWKFPTSPGQSITVRCPFELSPGP